MNEKAKIKRPRVDWESVEREYRTGVRSLRDIAEEFGCSHVAIKKRADKEGWPRDLSARITEQANAIVTKREVTKEVTAESKATEKSLVDANAKMLADKVLNQRSDIQRARAVVQRLWDAIATETDAPEEFKRLGEILRSPDQFGSDKLNDAYMYAVSLPQQIKSAKLLADALKTLIELERKVLKIDTTPDPSDAAKAFCEGIVKGMSEASKSFRDDLMAELVGSDE